MEPMLPQQQQSLLNGLPPLEDDEALVAGCHYRSATWRITALGLVFFAFNCVVTAFHSQGSTGVALCSYFTLLALLVSIKRYENAEPGSELRDRLRVSVRLLTAALGFLFSSQVATVMPPAATVAVSLLAFGILARAICYL